MSALPGVGLGFATSGRGLRRRTGLSLPGPTDILPTWAGAPRRGDPRWYTLGRVATQPANARVSVVGGAHAQYVEVVGREIRLRKRIPAEFQGNNLDFTLRATLNKQSIDLPLSRPVGSLQPRNLIAVLRPGDATVDASSRITALTHGPMGTVFAGPGASTTWPTRVVDADGRTVMRFTSAQYLDGAMQPLIDALKPERGTVWMGALLKRTSASATGQIMSASSTTTNKIHFQFYLTPDGAISCAEGDDVTVNTSIPSADIIADGVWNMAAAGYNGRFGRVYYNGRTVTAASPNANFGAKSTNVISLNRRAALANGGLNMDVLAFFFAARQPSPDEWFDMCLYEAKLATNRPDLPNGYGFEEFRTWTDPTDTTRFKAPILEQTFRTLPISSPSTTQEPVLDGLSMAFLDQEPNGWVPGTHNATSQAISPPANGEEQQVYLDQRVVPGVPPTVTLDPENDALVINAYPATQAQKDAIAAKGGSVGTKSYLAAMLTTRGWRSLQYGIAEFRAKAGDKLNGTWMAIWTLSKDAHHPPEFDIHEGFKGDSLRHQATAHLGTYEPSQRSALGNSADMPDLAEEWVTFGLEWTPDEVWYLCNGRRIIRQAPHRGVVAAAITGDGGGNLAMWNGSRNGTIRLRLVAPTLATAAISQASCVLEFTIANGRATSVVIVANGTGFAADGTGYTASRIQAIGDNSSGSTVVPAGLTFTIAVDQNPGLTTDSHLPQYFLLNLAMGGVSGGTIDPAAPTPRKFFVSSVRIAPLARPALRTLTGTEASACLARRDAYVSRVQELSAANGGAWNPTAPQLAALLDFYRLLRARDDLRRDYPTSGTFEPQWDWDSKRSMLDGLDMLYLPGLPGGGGRVCLIKPAETLLTEAGGPKVWTPAGVALPGLAGSYIETGRELMPAAISPPAWRSGDCSLIVGYSSQSFQAGTTSTGFAVAGCHENTRVYVCATDYGHRLNQTAAPARANKLRARPPAAGLIVATRGFDYSINAFVAGADEPLFSDYVTGRARVPAPAGSTLKLGAFRADQAGAAAVYNAIGAGRRLFPEEVHVLGEAIAALRAATAS